MGPVDGLFLGAGASFEVGMPLVWELTSELKNWLTPEHFRELNRGWRRQRGGHPDEIIDEVAALLAREDLHYENILGHLEAQFRRSGPRRDDYHSLYTWLVEMVYFVLHLRHINNADKIARNVRYLEGIARLANNVEPLWVFSLNHDVLVECVAAEFNQPLYCGFTAEQVHLPCRDSDGNKVGELAAEVVSSDQLEKNALPFATAGSRGINLLKIHGALDVFTFRDGKDLLRLLPSGDGAAGVIESLRAANEKLRYVDKRAPGGFIRAMNEIAYADDTGEMQFLRRTLLAGAFKFDAQQSQVLPMRMLDHFRWNLGRVSSLACVGYSFGDHHINQVLREWLERSAKRRIEVVDPRTADVPPCLAHLAPQVTTIKVGALEYFDQLGGVTRPRLDLLNRQMLSWTRRVGREESAQQLKSFMDASMDQRIKAFVGKLAAMPMRDGQIDLSALGVAPEDLVKRWSVELGLSAESMLEEFLASRATR